MGDLSVSISRALGQPMNIVEGGSAHELRDHTIPLNSSDDSDRGFVDFVRDMQHLEVVVWNS